MNEKPIFVVEVPLEIRDEDCKEFKKLLTIILPDYHALIIRHSLVDSLKFTIVR